MRTATAPRLSELLEYSHSEWYNETSLDINFAFSWSVVRYMMSDRRYIKILSGVLNRLAAGKCLEIDVLTHINRDYLGGVVAFEHSWHRWLRSGKEGVQVF